MKIHFNIYFLFAENHGGINIKPFVILFLIFLASNAYCQRQYQLSVNVKSDDYLPNRIIVKYKGKGVAKIGDLDQISGQSKRFQEKTKESTKIISANRKFRADQIDVLGKSRKLNAETVEENDMGNIYELQYSGSEPIEKVINRILLDSNVLYAEPHFVAHTTFIPSDSLYSNQGQNFLRQIQAPAAWNIVKNSTDIIIAIVDNGVDVTHEDLRDNLYFNTQDPVNGIDDDGDGFIDNYYGWDFGGKSATTSSEDNDPGIYKASASHGTHVSGLASAVSDNAKGISSVAFNAKLMIIKAASDDNENTISMGYEGIKYAADHGAQIINCSWGTTQYTVFGQDVVNYALSKGCLIVAAAGNGNNSDPIYPAAYPGVFAVASVSESDVKSPTSNFGDYVAIAAPGNNVLSTFYRNSYEVQSGTSMSAPIVSSAAALVKSYFHNSTMRQVGERLRETADVINNENPNGGGYLGRGRLNVFAALKPKVTSVRIDKITMLPTATPMNGDTVSIYFDLENYLDAVSDLEINLTSNSPFITIVKGGIDISRFTTLETRKNIGPFKLLVSKSIPHNTTVEFQLSYNSDANSYKSVEFFQVVFGLDYLNVQVNNIATTFTGNGRVGFSAPNQKNGLGFIYKDRNLLFESSLLIGKSALELSDNARNSEAGDEDFINVVGVKRLYSDSAAFEGFSEFNDSGNSRPINISIKHKQTVFADKPYDKFTIAEYEIFNTNDKALDGIYAGLFTDWDIDKNSKDITSFDTFNRLAYTYGKFDKTVFSGVKLLNMGVPAFYCPLTVDVPGNPLSNGFSKADKYQAMSGGIVGLSLGEKSSSGLDVSFVSGYGPIRIPAHESVNVAFALLAADNLDDLTEQADAAGKKYKLLVREKFAPELVLKQNVPNPARAGTQFQFVIPTDGQTKFEIYNSYGAKVTTLLDRNLRGGVYSIYMDTTCYPRGIYIYKLQFNQSVRALKMILN